MSIDLAKAAHAHLSLSPAAVPASRKKVAIAIALLADAAQGGMFLEMPALSWLPADAMDIVVAIVMLALLGFRWRILFALGFEMIPGVQLFPSWTAFVISLPTVEGEMKKLEEKGGTMKTLSEA
ncbi:hypothetical protein BH09MYX1_BH09MYX1_18200 [soil metagenome]